MALAKKTLARFDELMRRGIGETAASKHRAHGVGNIAFKLGLGDAVRLKVLPVEIRDAIGPQGFERPAEAPGR